MHLVLVSVGYPQGGVELIQGIDYRAVEWRCGLEVPGSKSVLPYYKEDQLCLGRISCFKYTEQIPPDLPYLKFEKHGYCLQH